LDHFRSGRRPIPALRHQPFQAHVAGRPKKVRPDLACLERRDEDAVRPPCQQPRKIGLPQRQWESAQVLAVEGQYVEGIELHLVIVRA
jgi:hypothetical protein